MPHRVADGLVLASSPPAPTPSPAQRPGRKSAQRALCAFKALVRLSSSGRRDRPQSAPSPQRAEPPRPQSRNAPPPRSEGGPTEAPGAPASTSASVPSRAHTQAVAPRASPADNPARSGAGSGSSSSAVPWEAFPQRVTEESTRSAHPVLAQGAAPLAAAQSALAASSAENALPEQPPAVRRRVKQPAAARKPFQAVCTAALTADAVAAEEDDADDMFVFSLKPEHTHERAASSARESSQCAGLARRASCTDLRVQAMLRSCSGVSRASEGEAEDAFSWTSSSSSPLRSNSTISEVGGATSASTLFSVETLSHATGGWAAENILGKGSFGTVFKGQLQGQTVAVKRLEVEGGSQQGSREYGTEVLVLSGIRHKHIVKLIGHCLEHHCLVYQFMPGGSLSEKLLQGPSFPWQQRIAVATQVACALEHLHSLPSPVVHRDLKPENILLDGEGAAMLGDVGLARILEGGEEITYTVCGTAGYIDPEAMSTFVISPAADVYAFGLILLQLLTGLPKVTAVHKMLSHGGVMVSSPTRAVAMATEKVLSSLDCSAGSWPLATVHAVAEVAVRCCQRQRVRRPNISGVVPILQGVMC